MSLNYQELLQGRSAFALKAAIAGALFALAIVASNVSAASSRTFSANVNGNKLQCFSGTADNDQLYGGDCAFDSNTAVIKTTDSGAEGSYAGVYIQNSNLGGKLLADVNKLAFTYDGTGATGGSPRLSIPIDNNNDSKADAYAFIDTNGCNDGDANKGTLDAINDVSCTVSYNNTQYTNWAAFIAGDATVRIAKDGVTFVIVDEPGTFNISNVQLGKGPAKPAQGQ
jgi:hypothetical protein